MIDASKAKPEIIEFTPDQIKLLKQMHIESRISTTLDRQTKAVAKSLVRKGYFYHNPDNFKFEFSI